MLCLFFRLDFDLVFGTNMLGMSKADRLIYGESLMTHAMTITAAQTVEVSIVMWTIIPGMIFFSYFPLKIVIRKSLDMVRTGKKLPI